MCFLKKQILAQNSKGLAFGFTKKRHFAKKLTETPYFLVVKPIFLIGYRKMPLCGKN
jgi:hypothetical protein